MPMKKLLTAFVLTALLLLPAASAAGDEGADALNRLGLFSGSEAGYELDRTPTRAEALVMLLKLTPSRMRAGRPATSATPIRTA